MEDSSGLSILELVCEVENATGDFGECADGIEPYRYEPYTTEMTEESGPTTATSTAWQRQM